MKVLLLCTSIEGGGAAHASLALLYALRQEGIEARMLTLFPSKNIRAPILIVCARVCWVGQKPMPISY